jgi:hypothetical protein
MLFKKIISVLRHRHFIRQTKKKKKKIERLQADLVVLEKRCEKEDESYDKMVENQQNALKTKHELGLID